MAYRWEARSTTPGDYRWIAASVAVMGVVPIVIGGISNPYCKVAGGEVRSIELNNAGEDEGTVFAGTMVCAISFWSNTMAVITMPANNAGLKDLSVFHADNGTSDTLTNGVRYYDPESEPIFVVEQGADPEDNAHD